MSETHLFAHFYRCDDCGEEFDEKGGEHRCEGTRAEILAMLEETRQENGDLRAAIERMIAASEAGSASDAIQDMLAIAEDALGPTRSPQKLFELTIYGASGHGVISHHLFHEAGFELLFRSDEPLLAAAVSAITIKPQLPTSREAEQQAIIAKLEASQEPPSPRRL